MLMPVWRAAGILLESPSPVCQPCSSAASANKVREWVDLGVCVSKSVCVKVCMPFT